MRSVFIRETSGILEYHCAIDGVEVRWTQSHSATKWSTCKYFTLQNFTTETKIILGTDTRSRSSLFTMNIDKHIALNGPYFVFRNDGHFLVIASDPLINAIPVSYFRWMAGMFFTCTNDRDSVGLLHYQPPKIRDVVSVVKGALVANNPRQIVKLWRRGRCRGLRFAALRQETGHIQTLQWELNVTGDLQIKFNILIYWFTVSREGKADSPSFATGHWISLVE